MKKGYLVFLLLFMLSGIAKAQVCKILIDYDQKGNRIKREKNCIGNRPADPSDSTLVSSGNDQSYSKDSTHTALAGTFDVYPNPASNQVNVRLDALSLRSDCSLTITDATGKTLYHKGIEGPETSLSLNGYADGIYFIILRRGVQINTIRIAKEYGAGGKSVR